jgi:phosphatidylethanolamine-binding protein (PEBP) family uncharacterized protein
MRKLQKPLAIFVNDPDAPPGGWFVHSPAWKMELGNMIPEKSQKLLRVLSLSGPSRKKNSFSRIGYNGQYPQQGRRIVFFFKVFELDTALPLKEGL